MNVKSTLLTCTAIALLCAAALAQSVPALINYQGQLTDAGGAPLATTDYMLTFTIHDAATGGIQIWGPQIFDGVGGRGHGAKIPVVQGYFNVMLGPVDTGGASIKDAFNATNRFVEIKVGNNNAITPRQQILSAPFAIKAESAEKLTMPGGATTAVSVAGNGNVGIGTAYSHESLAVAGNLEFQSADAQFGRVAQFKTAVGGDGTTDLGIWTRLGQGDYERMRITSTGNVGIGTTAPQSPLEVSGTIRTTRARVPSQYISQYADETGSHIRASAASGALSLGVRGDYLTVLDVTGNVGIGTTSPQRMLDVASDAFFRGKLEIGISTADNNNPPGIAYGPGNFLYEGEY